MSYVTHLSFKKKVALWKKNNSDSCDLIWKMFVVIGSNRTDQSETPKHFHGQQAGPYFIIVVVAFFY